MTLRRLCNSMVRKVARGDIARHEIINAAVAGRAELNGRQYVGRVCITLHVDLFYELPDEK
jgi:hypothetical protein